MRFTRRGQSCTAGSRLFLHQSIFDSFLDKLTAKLSAFKVGDPLDEATDMGAIINRKQFESICSYIEDGLQQKDARMVLGGLPPSQGPLAEGYAYVWCRDITKALRIAHAIESGWVQVNRGLGQFPGLTYGGYKQSGIGREFSLEAMLDGFTQTKSVTVGLHDQ
jgi:betaine-aldehyde dehydrogenase